MGEPHLINLGNNQKKTKGDWGDKSSCLGSEYSCTNRLHHDLQTTGLLTAVLRLASHTFPPSGGSLNGWHAESPCTAVLQGSEHQEMLNPQITEKWRLQEEWIQAWKDGQKQGDRRKCIVEGSKMGLPKCFQWWLSKVTLFAFENSLTWFSLPNFRDLHYVIFKMQLWQAVSSVKRSHNVQVPAWKCI